MLGTGVPGEFWAIVVISILLTGINSPLTEVVLLCAFAVLAFGAAIAALRVRPPRLIAILVETPLLCFPELARERPAAPRSTGQRHSR